MEGGGEDMKRESICPAIRALLPSLAEGTLGEDAASVVREHLDRCTECGRVWAVMNGIRRENEREEEPPIEQFVRKARRRRWILAFASVLAVLVLLAAAAGIVTELSGGVEVWIREDGETPNALRQTLDDAGKASLAPVRVRFRLCRTHYRLPWEREDCVTVTELVVTGEDGAVLFDYDPYGFGKPWPLPVLKGDGILSPLCAMNPRDPTDVKYAGRMVSADGMGSFVLQGEDFTLFYPASASADADRLIREIYAFCEKNAAPLGPWFEMGEE